MKSFKTLLSTRQIEILKLRKQGLTQKDIAGRLKTTRENINILESRAHRNIKRALATLEILEKLGLSIRVSVDTGTNILDIPKIILDAADKAGIKVNCDCVDILENIKLHGKIVKKKVIKPLTVTIFTDGNLTVE